VFKHALSLAQRGDLELPDLLPQQIQPNAIDITCDRLFKDAVIPNVEKQPFTLTHSNTSHTDKVELFTPFQYSAGKNPDDVWKALRKSVYYFESDLEVTVPWGYVGWLITRSSLNRNGIRVESGLYDSGFKGKLAGTIYNHNHYNVEMNLERRVRIAQFVMAEADTLRKYDGQYQSKKA
jgi:deoxycytidine triphosphate deaminase